MYILQLYNNYINTTIRILIWRYTVLKQIILHIKIKGKYDFVLFFSSITFALILSVCYRWEDHPCDSGADQIRACCVTSDQQRIYLPLKNQHTFVLRCRRGSAPTVQSCWQSASCFNSDIQDGRLQTNSGHIWAS